MVVELTLRKFYVQLICAATQESRKLKSELILFSHKNGDKNIKKKRKEFYGRCVTISLRIV